MRKRTVIVTFLALAVLTLLVIEWPVTQHDLPVTHPAPGPAPTAAISTEKPAPKAVPTPAPPAPLPVQPDPPVADQQGTPDSPGDPLAPPENPTEQFMHSRRGDGQHSE
jgi:hypothetical protein